jgi:hypothetical protein
MATLTKVQAPKRPRSAAKTSRPIDKVCGKYARVRYSTADFVQDKRRELAREA